jgi:basic membrane protein A
MSKKFITLLAILLLAAMVLSACGNGNENANTGNTGNTDMEDTGDEDTGGEFVGMGADCPDDGELKFGLVTDVGEVDDKGFNQAAWESVQAAGEKYGATVDYVETKDAKDYGSNIGLFLAEDYDVIVTVGFALGEATELAAGENPCTYFIGLDQFPAGELANFSGLVFNEDHSGFLAGALAALMTKTDIIAGVYGTNIIPAVVYYYEGYIAGAKYINPDIEVISTYHPGGLDVAFTDPEWGATTAAQAIDAGADFVFGAGGKTGNGAVIEAAGHEGVFCIGVDLDQWITIPEAHPCMVTSALKLIGQGFDDLFALYMNGEPYAGAFFGAAGIAPFHDFEDIVPDDVKTQLEEIAAGLADGTIQTGVDKTTPAEE